MTAPGLASDILEVVPRPVWVVDADGAVAFANPAAARALGYDDPHDLYGRPSHETLHGRRPDGSHHPAAECPLLRPTVTGEPATAADQWIIRRDGSLFPISWTSSPIAMPNGTGAVLTFTDITDIQARQAAVHMLDRAEIRAAGPRRSVHADRATLLEAVRTFVAENVTDPALSPGLLARTHHVSLRLLQSVFSDLGVPPARYIRDQRLAHARVLLREGRTVARSAELSGFSDPGTFARAFRRRYGSTPTEFVEAEP